MFKNIEELRQYVEEECYIVAREPDRCYVCGNFLVDGEGYTHYHMCEDYPDEKFCSEECIVEYLISMGHLEEEK